MFDDDRQRLRLTDHITIDRSGGQTVAEMQVNGRPYTLEVIPQLLPNRRTRLVEADTVLAKVILGTFMDGLVTDALQRPPEPTDLWVAGGR